MLLRSQIFQSHYTVVTWDQTVSNKHPLSKSFWHGGSSFLLCYYSSNHRRTDCIRFSLTYIQLWLAYIERHKFLYFWVCPKNDNVRYLNYLNNKIRRPIKRWKISKITVHNIITVIKMFVGDRFDQVAGCVLPQLPPHGVEVTCSLVGGLRVLCTLNCQPGFRSCHKISK